MKKSSWVKKIKKACEEAGTYRPYFDHTILTLAEILEKRDDAAQAYKDYGSIPLIEYTNKGGATNLVKNPAIILWDDLNKSALAYWRDLGLTPAGLKKIDEKAMKSKKRSGLEEALEGLGG
ncbi:MAG: P27 family phage terminase small subunit [Lachnospiraceae bacterium]|jgi:hypothetical protein|nr:P27 family phage terminase small subunit [Lachnospiraceae bacterium]